MTRIAILGSKGSMGKRYEAILKYLNCEVAKYDIDTWGQVVSTVGLDGVIIASPTENHWQNMKEISRLNIPFLCEKPLTKTQEELNLFLDIPKLTMVNQYAYLQGIDGDGDTYYDYYNTGKDGLEWDCINIIGLAKKTATINDASPTWECMINGKKINLQDVNQAYVDMVDDWLAKPKSNFEYIEKAHKKVWEKDYVKGRYRDPSEIKQQQIAQQVPHGYQRKNHAGMGR